MDLGVTQKDIHMQNCSRDLYAVGKIISASIIIVRPHLNPRNFATHQVGKVFLGNELDLGVSQGYIFDRVADQ